MKMRAIMKLTRNSLVVSSEDCCCEGEGEREGDDERLGKPVEFDEAVNAPSVSFQTDGPPWSSSEGSVQLLLPPERIDMVAKDVG
jgi:hypothetical protein